MWDSLEKGGKIIQLITPAVWEEFLAIPALNYCLGNEEWKNYSKKRKRGKFHCMVVWEGVVSKLRDLKNDASKNLNLLIQVLF